jgi:hypothetical protein
VCITCGVVISRKTLRFCAGCGTPVPQPTAAAAVTLYPSAADLGVIADEEKEDNAKGVPYPVPEPLYVDESTADIEQRAMEAATEDELRELGALEPNGPPSAPTHAPAVQERETANPVLTAVPL